MAERQELQVVLRTVAEGQGAQQTATALRQVRQEAAQTTSQTQRMVMGIASAAAGFLTLQAAAQVATSVFSASINAQRENERVVRATGAAYGQQAKEFERFASALAAQTGFTSQAILEAALSARTLSTNYGLTIQQTQALIRASADLARVRGIGVAEAFERVQSAIRGEAEASEYLGLTLNDTYIKNNAMNGSLKTTFERMTDAQKAQIRYNEVLKQAAPFMDLATKGTNSLDGAMLRAESSANRLAIAMGKVVEPATVHLLDAATQSMKDLSIIMELEPKNPNTSVQDYIKAIKAATPQPSEVRAQARIQQGLIPRFDESLVTAPLREVIRPGGPSATERAAAARAADRQRDYQSLREIAYLDQRDAAVRDLLSAQREELDLKTQLAQMERAHGDMAARRYQIELASIAAQQRALPAQMALQDTERAIERARLVLGIRGTSAADRSAARAQIRDLTRNVAPGQRLAAFDAETGVLGARRQETAFDLSARVAQISIEQAIAAQGALIDAAAARTDAQQQVLGGIIQQAITDGFLKAPPAKVSIQVVGPDGQVTYEELIEATDQAQMPPVVRVSGVRR